MASSRPRAWPSCTGRSRTRWCWCSPRWSTSASRSTSTSCARLGKRLSDEVQTLQLQLREVAGRDDLQPQLADAAARDPLHGTGPVAGQEDQDRLLHRCGDAGEDPGPVARVHRAAAAVPRGREAPQHLRRGPAGRGRTRRADPRHLQPDRGAHGSTLVRSAEPAQHPRAHRGGTPVPQGVRPGARHDAARCRLQPDRAALHRPSRRGPRSDRGVHERPGHPQRHRGAGVRCRPVVGHRRAALEGEDGVVRAGLRHGVLRTRPAAEHSDRGGCGHPRRVLRGVPQREGLHGPHGDRGPRARLHRDPVRTSSTDSRADRTRTSGSVRRGSARR